MKIDEVRKLSDQEISEQIYECKAKLMELAFQQKAGALKNGKDITDVRKTIAKLLTVKKERELASKVSK